ncbi:MAG: hypothetical protein NE327_01865 [Lentisphaeraceae bacterium]|nr:hypothetical protein [Lentisphaeraceae bacterium]
MKKFISKLITRNSENSLRELAQPMIIAVDFDGTCVREKYPEVGEDLPGAVQTLHALVAREHKIILWTCREGKELEDAIQWYKDRDIELYGINETPLDGDFRSDGGRKVYANLYIDDKIFGGFPGWNKIHEELIGMPLIF